MIIGLLPPGLLFQQPEMVNLPIINTLIIGYTELTVQSAQLFHGG